MCIYNISEICYRKTFVIVDMGRKPFPEMWNEKQHSLENRQPTNQPTSKQFCFYSSIFLCISFDISSFRINCGEVFFFFLKSCWLCHYWHISFFSIFLPPLNKHQHQIQATLPTPPPLPPWLEFTKSVLRFTLPGYWNTQGWLSVYDLVWDFIHKHTNKF